MLCSGITGIQLREVCDTSCRVKHPHPQCFQSLAALAQHVGNRRLRQLLQAL